MTTRKAVVASLVVVALAAGCGSTTTAPATTAGSSTATTSVKAAPTSPPLATASSSAPASVSENNPCAGAPYSAQQFTGDWIEEGGSGVTTLGADGTLSIREGSAAETGTWSYSPWQFTSAADQMPPSAAGQCVLWLRIVAPAPATNFVYAVLKVASDSLELSYVGRGNTLEWKRSAAGS